MHKISPARLAAVIATLGITDTEVVAITGIGKSTLYRWKRGEAPIHPGILKLLELMVIVDAQGNPALRAFLKGEATCKPSD